MCNCGKNKSRALADRQQRSFAPPVVNLPPDETRQPRQVAPRFLRHSRTAGAAGVAGEVVVQPVAIEETQVEVANVEVANVEVANVEVANVEVANVEIANVEVIPSTEAPVMETPVTETPVAEVAVAEAPTAQAPQVASSSEMQQSASEMQQGAPAPTPRRHFLRNPAGFRTQIPTKSVPTQSRTQQLHAKPAVTPSSKSTRPTRSYVLKARMIRNATKASAAKN